MKKVILLSLLLIIACNNSDQVKKTTKVNDLATVPDTLQVLKENEPVATPPKTYSNERFRDVTVDRISQDTFIIRGQGQIFEANFNWVVEDGHYELKKGFQMTDAGAPDWGKFEFTISVQKKRQNSSLTLILFESSPKDGSQQHELLIPLN